MGLFQLAQLILVAFVKRIVFGRDADDFFHFSAMLLCASAEDGGG